MHKVSLAQPQKKCWLDPDISYIEVYDTASGGGTYPDGESATGGEPNPGS